MNRLYNLKRFLKNFSGTQVFNTRNCVGDKLELVYEQNGIYVEYCSDYNYIEIFGLTEEEWNDISIYDDFTKTSKVVRDFEEYELYEEEV